MRILEIYPNETTGPHAITHASKQFGAFLEFTRHLIICGQILREIQDVQCFYDLDIAHLVLASGSGIGGVSW